MGLFLSLFLCTFGVGICIYVFRIWFTSLYIFSIRSNGLWITFGKKFTWILGLPSLLRTTKIEETISNPFTRLQHRPPESTFFDDHKPTAYSILYPSVPQQKTKLTLSMSQWSPLEVLTGDPSGPDSLPLGCAGSSVPYYYSVRKSYTTPGRRTKPNRNFSSN